MAMKRANGTGTVYKMKHKPLRRPYRAVVTLGYDSEETLAKIDRNLCNAKRGI